MGNNELLLAISDMMDQKLESINVRMDTMEDRLSARIDALDAKVDALDTRLSGRIDALDAKVDALDAKVDALDAKIDAVEERLSGDIIALDAKMAALDERLSANIRDVKITMENVLIPRIKHMEQCYLDTSKRYINETGRIDGLVADVQVIKSVVLNHSEQLQKIS